MGEAGNLMGATTATDVLVIVEQNCVRDVRSTDWKNKIGALHASVGPRKLQFLLTSSGRRST